MIHGDAAGADRIAASAAKRVGLDVVAVPAQWEVHSEQLLFAASISAGAARRASGAIWKCSICSRIV